MLHQIFYTAASFRMPPCCFLQEYPFSLMFSEDARVRQLRSLLRGQIYALPSRKRFIISLVRL